MKKHLAGFAKYMKQVGTEFIEDNILKYSASLAYYTVFSLAPLLIIIISVCELFLRKEAIQGHVYNQIKDLVGSDAARQVQDAIKNAGKDDLIFVGGSTFVVGDLLRSDLNFSK